jgi:hypothetical protein
MIGVHISDVSYFLKEGTPLDQEVAKKATSTYLVESVSIGTFKPNDFEQHSAIPHLNVLDGLTPCLPEFFLQCRNYIQKQ